MTAHVRDQSKPEYVAKYNSAILKSLAMAYINFDSKPEGVQRERGYHQRDTQRGWH